MLGLGDSLGTWDTVGSTPAVNKTPTNNNSLINNNSTEEAEEFAEVLDWIEVLIDRIERKIQDLDTVANSAYKNFSKRNKSLVDEYSLVTQEIEIQQKAYEKYMERFNSMNLSSEYKQKILEGKLQIEDITDEDLHETIQEAQEWADKALDAKYATTDLKETLGDLVQTKFDNVVSEFESLISIIEHTTDSIDTALSIVEAKGQFASEKYFQNLMSTEKENISMLQKEYAALLYEFEDAMKTGAIEEGSESWYDMKEQIRDVESALQDANLALIEYRNEMWEMDWSVFEKQLEYIEEITKESEFLVNLLSHNENDLFGEKNGKLTDSGFAVGGLHAVDYNVYMAEAQKYADKVKEINAELAKDPTNTILLDKKNEYLEAQREAISNANDEKLAIRDLIEESYNRMLEILQELIDKRKEALQAEKDLYSYEKDVREQTKQITDYQKQLKALQGDDSEETKSRRQQLQESLKEAQSNLEETEYDRWLSDQEQLMDEMYTQFEEVLNERLDNIDGLLQEMINHTNANAETINSTISSATDKVGYTLTEGMQDIWDTTDSGLGKVVSEFNSNFMSTLTTTNEYINKIYKLINKNVENADKDYDANTTPAAGITPSASSSSASMSSGSSSSSGSSPSSSSSGNSSSSLNKGSFFIYKRDQYPKSKLNVNTSIVDRLKYHNFDPSWSAMSSYYKAMGGSGTYQGTYKQNTFMLNWMKSNGFKHSGQLKSMMNRSQEDGLFLGRADDTILAKEDWLIAKDMTSKLVDFAKYQSILKPANSGSVENNIQMSITLPNVTNYNEFVNQLQKDKRFEKIVQAISVDSVMGKNSLNKYKH